jgi:hypothetical protein
MLRSVYLVIVIALLLNAKEFAQRKLNKNGEATKSDTAFLNFERMGKRDPIKPSESSEGIRLRLQNRSDSILLVPVLRTKKIRSRHSSEIEVVPIYSIDCVKPGNSCGSIPPGIDQSYTGYGRLIASFELKPGHSWLVSLPKNHLSEGLQICINVILRDKRKTESAPQNEKKDRICFRNDDLPEGIR